MKKKGLKSLFSILIILIIICTIAFGIFIFIKKDTNGIVSNLFNQKEEPKEEVKDNKNGVYLYEEKIPSAYAITASCTVNSVKNYILVINKEYKIYRSTCMGTYLKKQGNTNDLEIKYNDEKKLYQISYDNNTYNKDNTVTTIKPNNNIETALKRVNLESYAFILKETQFTGNYYEISSAISGTNGKFTLNIKPNLLGGFYIEILGSQRQVIYSYNASNLDNLPQLRPLSDKIIILEKNHVNGLNNYSLKAITDKQIIYNLDNMLPITINNTTLNKNNSIYIKYDSINKKYKMLVGYDNKYCKENSTGNNVTYYEFEIVYDYSTSNLSKPEFKNIGYEKDGCTVVEKIME